MSSNTITNNTQTFVIAENDWREKTGNVTFLIEISAFNQNFSVYERQSQNTRMQLWRWRRAEYSFNLTVLHSEQELYVPHARHHQCIDRRARIIIKNCEETDS